LYVPAATGVNDAGPYVPLPDTGNELDVNAAVPVQVSLAHALNTIEPPAFDVAPVRVAESEIGEPSTAVGVADVEVQPAFEFDPMAC